MSNKLKKTLAVVAILLFGAINFGNSDEKGVLHVETYKVRNGDTFWNISQRYYDLDDRKLYIFEYMDELRELNPQLEENHYQLQPNDLIRMQYVKFN